MTRKMLIVDDEESILKLLVTIFGPTNDYTIFCARDGETALKAARADNPDIMLLDNRLPGISGLEVCGKVKSDPTMSLIKVLILSCQGQNFDWQKAREMGADSYITKPFNSSLLVEKVAELLGNN